MPEGSPVPTQSLPQPELGARLESWKEIAAYLKRDISTVQRWEKKEGLPIHRLPHDKLGSVFAFQSELDTWLNRGVRDTDPATAPERPAPDQSGSAHMPGLNTAAPSVRGTRSFVYITAIAISAALTGVLAGGGITWSRRPETPDGHNHAPEIRFVVSTPPVAVEQPATAGDAPIVISPDGSVIVYVATDAGVRRLYQRRLSDPASLAIPGTEGAQTPFLSPDGRWVGFTRFTGTGAGGRLQKVALAGGEPVTICELPGGRGATWGSDGTIVFAPHPDSGLWQVPATGGVPQPLTQPNVANGERSHRWPFFVPGRRLLLYSIAKSDITSFDDALVAVRDLDSGQETELLRGGSYPMYLEASQQLLYVRAGTLMAARLDVNRRAVVDQPAVVLTDIVTYPHTGAAAVAVSTTGVLASTPGGSSPPSGTTVSMVDRQGRTTVIPFPPGAMAGVRLAPNQRTVAMEIDGANSALWVGDLRNATLARLTPQWTHWSAVWSPDGRRLAFTSGRGGGRNVFVQRVDRPEEPERLTTTDRTHLVTSWSADGRYLAYDDQTATMARDVAIFDLGTRKSTPLIHSPADEYSGRFSPDVRYLAFVSNESGRPEVYLHALQQDTLKAPISRGHGGTNPVWARDGGELFYRNGDAMMAVKVRTTPSLSVGEPRLLFRKRTIGNDFDVTADGHFLMVEDRRGVVVRPFTVTVNWMGPRRP